MQKRVINPTSWSNSFGFVQANEIIGATRFLQCSGQVDVDPDGNPLHPGDMKAQAAGAWDNLEALLEQAGYSLADVIHITYYTTDVPAYIEAQHEIGVPRLKAAGCEPTCTLLGISALGFSSAMIEIEALAVK